VAEPIDMLIQTVNRVEGKIDKIVDTMVTKDECKNSRENCIQGKKIEWSAKKITAMTGLITGSAASLMALVKLFFIK
jgi:hypothetical protein